MDYTYVITLFADLSVYLLLRIIRNINNYNKSQYEKNKFFNPHFKRKFTA